MLKQHIATGKTEEEAVQEALKVLGAERDDVEVEVLVKAESGILWRSGKQAKVQVTIKDDPLVWAKIMLVNIIRLLGIEDAKVTVERSPYEDTLQVDGENLGRLVGPQGSTLSTLQFFLHTAISKAAGKPYHFQVDVQGYLKRRRQKTIELAKDAARRVRLTGQEMVLERLAPYERRIVHLTLKDHPDVATTSRGEGERRKLVVVPKVAAPREAERRV